ncbi:hypothetical protein SLEP1_g24049 [Rubroshorea leprosula]|uniref:Uncharacterized protein n=1 Tax=Rubroshorea leprosula TaxID=152421 RepID=A0AAV5JJK7_9ROSI|nr:hypothetical protein SLEP1_g24049 [Rubroshorea leprosula]
MMPCVIHVGRYFIVESCWSKYLDKVEWLFPQLQQGCWFVANFQENNWQNQQNNQFVSDFMLPLIVKLLPQISKHAAKFVSDFMLSLIVKLLPQISKHAAKGVYCYKDAKKKRSKEDQPLTQLAQRYLHFSFTSNVLV